ncbi:MAG: potassium-transporting ATPase subunit KdpB [Alphaproteobacteria bacterium]|nr:potassium-transporting ATPase subunit KdpB [Alphaproteobacteria bacterium]
MVNFAPIVGKALLYSIGKMNPLSLVRTNPIIFLVWLGAIITSGQVAFDHYQHGSLSPQSCFSLRISVWLWLTVLMAVFCEAIAEGRGRAQASFLKKNQKDLWANRLESDGSISRVGCDALVVGDIVIVNQGEIIPSDGEIIKGIAAIDESSITGESAPAIRESGGDRSAVTGGTLVLSDQITVRITAARGSTVIDKMIALVEGAERHLTPNEIALNYLLLAMTAIFLIVVFTLPAFSLFLGHQLDLTTLIALLVTLIPTTIGGLLSAIGIAGMNRLLALNVLAKSGRAVEAAGDIDIMLFDKTGTVTVGNRCAVEFIPLLGIQLADFVEAASIASYQDETAEGRSIIQLAKQKYKWIPADDIVAWEHNAWDFIPFTATTRTSGVKNECTEIRKGAEDSILDFVRAQSGNEDYQPPAEYCLASTAIAEQGGTPLGLAKNGVLMGVIHLKDQIKPGFKHRVTQLRRMGIRTCMITGDNPITARAIAAEAGIDDTIPQATPEQKLSYLIQYQQTGHMVSMCGDGTNDAPALAQADVGVAMNTGTQAAKEAGNMVDLDSDPTKIMDIVGVGKQMLMTRGALTTFSIANDVAKYFAILPSLFGGIYPPLNRLNIMHLKTPESAILSAIIFNALILIALLPLALRGVKFKASHASDILRRNFLIYGLGGIITPFMGIKLIDLILQIQW